MCGSIDAPGQTVHDDDPGFTERLPDKELRGASFASRPTRSPARDARYGSEPTRAPGGARSGTTIVRIVSTSIPGSRRFYTRPPRIVKFPTQPGRRDRPERPSLNRRTR